MDFKALKESLTRKIGPFPTYVWVILAGIVGGVLWYEYRKSKGNTADPSTDSNGESSLGYANDGVTSGAGSGYVDSGSGTTTTTDPTKIEVDVKYPDTPTSTNPTTPAPTAPTTTTPTTPISSAIYSATPKTVNYASPIGAQIAAGNKNLPGGNRVLSKPTSPAIAGYGLASGSTSAKPSSKSSIVSFSSVNLPASKKIVTTKL